jgi:hypothetical protein
MHIVPWFMQTAIFRGESLARLFWISENPKSSHISGSSRKNFISVHLLNTCHELLRMDLKESWNIPDFRVCASKFPKFEQKYRARPLKPRSKKSCFLEGRNTQKEAPWVQKGRILSSRASTAIFAHTTDPASQLHEKYSLSRFMSKENWQKICHSHLSWLASLQGMENLGRTSSFRRNRS